MDAASKLAGCCQQQVLMIQTHHTSFNGIKRTFHSANVFALKVKVC
jgi:hypothetical protein